MSSLPALRDCDAVLAIDGAIHTVWLSLMRIDGEIWMWWREGAEGMEISGSSLSQLKGWRESEISTLCTLHLLLSFRLLYSLSILVYYSVHCQHPV